MARSGLLRVKGGVRIGHGAEPYAVGELTVDYAGHRVSLAGRPMRLTDTESRILLELSVNAGRGAGPC